MIQVELTPHLFAFFPDLKGRAIALDVATVRDMVNKLEELAPGLGFYLCDELGALRTHVNIFVADERIVDRERLSDRLKPGMRVTVMQALSGG